MLGKKLQPLFRNSVSLTPFTFFNGGLSWLRHHFSASGYSYAPISVKIGVNSVCNARCKTCDLGTGHKTTYYANMDFDKQQLDYDLALRVIDSLAMIRPKIVIDSTEPLLYRPLFDLIRSIKQARMKCMVQTNGLKLQTFAEAVMESGVDDIGVSIDGTADVHDEIRGVRGMYGKVIAGLHQIQRLKRDQSSKHPTISINYVISSHSQHVISDFVKELAAMDISINAVNFYHQSFISEKMAALHNRTWEHQFPVTPTNCSEANPEEVDCRLLAEQVQHIQHLTFPFQVRWIPFLENEAAISTFYHEHLCIVSNAKCLVPWFTCRINPDGSVSILTRCFHVMLGNVKDQTIMEIFNGKPMRDFRRLLKHEKIFPACTRCCGLF